MVTFFSPTIFASPISTILSTSRKGYLWGRYFMISLMSIRDLLIRIQIANLKLQNANFKTERIRTLHFSFCALHFQLGFKLCNFLFKLFYRLSHLGKLGECEGCL